MKGNRAFFERLASSLIIPVTLLPLAALMLAAGSQLGIPPLQAAGLAIIQSWLPLFYAVGLAIGFSEGDAMAVLSAVITFLTMQSVAVAVAGDPGLNMGVLGGLVTGAIATWLFHRVKRWQLPEWLGLFSGKRMGPVVGTVAGAVLGMLAGWSWPPIKAAIIQLGQWLYAAGPAGAFVYGAVTRLLIPTGLHHILLQAVDNQIGGWTDPATGKLVTGEYLRFLAGDPAAGRFLSGFFLTLGFAGIGVAAALVINARALQRKRVAGLMWTGVLTAAVLGITEPIEFAFIFGSPLLWGLHVIFSGFASLITYLLGIRAGGYALPMLLINAQQSERAWLILPLGLAWSGLYFVSFHWVIRRWRPRVLGQEEGDGPALPDPEAAAGSLAGEAAAGAQMLACLGGAPNLVRLDACMTRLRVLVVEQDRVDADGLRALGAVALVWDGPNLQVVLGTRAPRWRELVVEAMASEGATDGAEGATVEAGGSPTGMDRSVVIDGGGPAGMVQSSALAGDGRDPDLILLAPLTGRLLSLAELDDQVFAGGALGQGAAIDPSDGWLLAPCRATVAAIFPGGHAIGLVTADGTELLIHLGLGTFQLGGQGIHLRVQPGERVEAGQVLGWLDRSALQAAGAVLTTPFLVTSGQAVKRLADGEVQAGAPLFHVLR